MLHAQEEAPRPIELTENEKAFLAKFPVVRVAVEQGRPPFAFVEKGVLVGIEADLLTTWGTKLGIQFQPVVVRKWDDAVAQLREGKVDMLMAAMKNGAYTDIAQVTDSYFVARVVVVSHKDAPPIWTLEELGNKRIVAPFSYSSYAQLKQRYPKAKFIDGRTELQTLFMVDGGQGQYAFTSSALAAHAAKTWGLGNLRVASGTANVIPYGCAVPRQLPELHSILNKVIAAGTPEEKIALSERWIGFEADSRLQPIFWLKIVGTIVGVALLIGGAMLWYQRRMRRELDARRVLQEQLEAANMQLEAANSALVDSNREKAELMRIAVHDIRTPLTSVMLGLKLLREDLSASGLVKADHVELAAKRIGRLVKDLLDVQALEQKNRETKAEKLNIAGELDAVARSLDCIAGDKDIRLRLELADALPCGKGDLGLFRQVLDNLVTNALKFSPRNTTVTLRASAQHGFVCIEVQDQGPGVPDAEKERIFMKYQRGTAQPTAGEPSTGLGLAIVRQAVTLMNGRVWCENAPGGGACFVVTLPTLIETVAQESHVSATA